VIQSALAAIRTAANLGFPAAIPALAAQAVALAAQLATINSQQFARGGLVNGKPHSQGGEHFVVRSTGQRVELEGGEAVINKRSMSSRDVLTVTGTPAQIANRINTYKGYGNPIAVPSWAKPVTLSRRMFEAGGVVPAQPQFVNPNTSMQAVTVNVEMTDEQIDVLARTIANRTAQQTGQSVGLALNN
ncbi:hypothetical protein RZS08_14460, partial [Arthrospira platensis SPKY1]|nr:hypothetical protein [Arthrospira platensis SPKY1]